MTASEIRQQFLDFFRSKGHTIVPSAPLVMKDDPTLMFVNAGMNPFKDIFTGAKPAQHKRVADTQKCLRVSGKHNDLEEVGIDTYHHTLFEMLGNWSFGDYFKQDAIDWAWELLTEVYGLDPDRMYVTVFEGDAAEGLDRDEEAASIWAKHVPADRILNGDKKDNFWEMGETGPCGPCSEIHVDLRTDVERKAVDGASLVNMDHPQVIEIWNLVFMQFQRMSNGELQPLPEQHVDTGMGFERLVRAIEGKQSNYDTDVFKGLITRLETISNTTYGDDEGIDIAMRVIADHIRAVAFAIADGQLPSNTGAGYVIRRILRRATRYGYSTLNFREPFMVKMVPDLMTSMGQAFPELEAQQNLLTQVIEEEEQSFLRTLESGLKRLETLIKGGKLSGQHAFELYDTFGFPLDLTALICREQSVDLDEAGFHEAMAEQKARSKQAGAQKVGDWVEVHPGEGDQFVGYDQLEVEAQVLRYREVEDAKGRAFHVVLAPTPFYPEGGGQVGDSGVLRIGDQDITVHNTTREPGVILHHVTEWPTDAPDAVLAMVDDVARQRSAQNHSATHLLHKALRDVLGDHVAQRGSYVAPDQLRFDFSHFQKMTAEEILAVEAHVSEAILLNDPCQEHRDCPMDQAQAMGAIALFGEKYGDSVRVIEFGESVELCGGTHVPMTGVLSPFIIISEASVAAGVRRVEALAGDTASAYLKAQRDQMSSLLQATKGQDPLQVVSQLREEVAGLRADMAQHQRAQAGNLKGDLVDQAVSVGPYQLIAREVELDAASAKDLVFQIKDANPHVVIALGLNNGGKAQLHLAAGDAALEVVHAGQWVKELGRYIQGGGGGQPFYASAGGKKPDGLPELFKELQIKLQSCVD